MIFRAGLILLILFPGLVMAQAIDGFTGTFEHGSSVEIFGTSFGSKPNANPVTWDDVESGSFNPDWQGDGYMVVGSDSRHSNSLHCGTLNMGGSQGELGNYGCFQGDNGTLGQKWFCQFWFKLDENFDWGTSTYGNGDQNLANVKIFRMWNPSSSVNENFHINVHGYSGSGLIQYNSEYISDVGGGSFGNHWNWTKGVWHCLQFEFMDSSVDVNDGQIRVWLNGVLELDDNDIKTREDYAQFKRPMLLGFYDAWNDGGTDRDDFYIDDAYIDNSWARVEIGNNADYNSCTHREIQIPSAWDSEAISVDVNMGSFGNTDEVYLFVVDEAGQVSDGFLVSEGSEGPGQPGKPVRTE